MKIVLLPFFGNILFWPHEPYVQGIFTKHKYVSKERKLMFSEKQHTHLIAFPPPSFSAAWMSKHLGNEADGSSQVS